MIKIVEYTHFGRISKSGFAELEVDVRFNEKNKIYKNLKAFIDTGANSSCINEKYLIDKIDVSGFNTHKSDSANGSYQSKQIPNVGISLPMLDDVFIPLEMIGTINLEILEYDFIIGNDILHMCQLIYNGLSKTYILKLFQTTTNVRISIK